MEKFPKERKYSAQSYRWSERGKPQTLKSPSVSTLLKSITAKFPCSPVCGPSPASWKSSPRRLPNSRQVSARPIFGRPRAKSAVIKSLESAGRVPTQPIKQAEKEVFAGGRFPLQRPPQHHRAAIL